LVNFGTTKNINDENQITFALFLSLIVVPVYAEITTTALNHETLANESPSRNCAIQRNKAPPRQPVSLDRVAVIDSQE
jgi:hypothetical protein